MRKVTVAATQMSCTWNKEETLMKADRLVRDSSSKRCKYYSSSELFETPYFCQHQDIEYFKLAATVEDMMRSSISRRLPKN
jgi:N-carbamoylputrescine amidase